MNIDSAFESAYLKTADLQGRHLTLLIGAVDVEDVGTEEKPEHKPVMYFQGKKKGLILNKTNAAMLKDIFGPETDTWTGQPITLYPDRTMFRGEMVDCLRVRRAEVQAGQAPQASAPVATASPPPAAPPQQHRELSEDEIPF